MECYFLRCKRNPHYGFKFYNHPGIWAVCPCGWNNNSEKDNGNYNKHFDIVVRETKYFTVIWHDSIIKELN